MDVGEITCSSHWKMEEKITTERGNNNENSPIDYTLIGYMLETCSEMMMMMMMMIYANEGDPTYNL